MPEVVLIRRVEYKGDGQYYGRRMMLPIAPFRGLVVPWDRDFDSHHIWEIGVNPQGDILCKLDDEHWGALDCPEEHWPNVLAGITQGWHPLGDDWGWKTSVPRAAAPSLPGSGEPTPGPWRLSAVIKSDLGGMLPIAGPDGVTIGYVLEDTYRPGRMEADANLIISVVNAYRGMPVVP